MIELKKQPNRRIFNLKTLYRPQETFNYQFKVFNHITKTGFETEITDINPWLEGKQNQTEIEIGEKEVFNPGQSHYINNVEKTFIFNDKIQIDGVNHTFYHTPDIYYTKTTKLNDTYIIAFDENKGVLVQVNQFGNVLKEIIFNANPITNINIHSINDNSVVVGYYDTVADKSYIREINVNQNIIYNPTMFFDGWSKELKINKINDQEFVITYQSGEGIIQKCKVSNDHIFSVGFPFIFNDNFTVFSDSTYVNGNVVVLYYDVDDQLKVRNCRIYNDYIGVGLPKIVKDNYCYDLNINTLNDNYVYIVYFNASINKIETSMLLIDNDLTVIENGQTFDDWSEGLDLSTDGGNYIISYMDQNYEGVYREVNVIGGVFEEIKCEYNEFIIDLTDIDLSKNTYHNDYWIYYNNEVVEKGIVFIKNN